MLDEIKDVLSALKQHLVLAEKSQQNKEEIEKLRKSHDKLDEKFIQFVEKVQVLLEKHLEMTEKVIENVREKEAAERKIALLELENKFLKSNKNLPSGEIEKGK